MTDEPTIEQLTSENATLKQQLASVQQQAQAAIVQRNNAILNLVVTVFGTKD